MFEIFVLMAEVVFVVSGVEYLKVAVLFAFGLVVPFVEVLKFPFVVELAVYFVVYLPSPTLLFDHVVVVTILSEVEWRHLSDWSEQLLDFEVVPVGFAAFAGGFEVVEVSEKEVFGLI